MRCELAVMPRPHSKPRAYVRLQLFVADADVFEIVTGGVVVAQHRAGAGVVGVRAVVVVRARALLVVPDAVGVVLALPRQDVRAPGHGEGDDDDHGAHQNRPPSTIAPPPPVTTAV